MPEMPKAYNPQEVEDKIYKRWEESGFFNPDNLDLLKNKKDDKKNRFVISMPPPNATGVLHLGHASMLAYQDLMIRYNRMKGKRTLWLPGMDHAAIATQAKVEKIIAGEGKTKYDLDREKFLERVREFVENSRDIIRSQVRKMGSSCDWSRERYTLDEGLSRAVREVFVKMYNDGLIYRGTRIVNWCPRCESTLADDEVEYKKQKAKLYYFKYTKDFPIVIASTRPETKLGDAAVAVNPEDERYKKYIDKVYKVDLGNGEREIKIVADRGVDMTFGTGALGVTPAHSMIDYEMAKKNDLPVIKIIGEDGRMTSEAGENYKGLTVLEAREKFVKYLEENGLIEKVEEIDQNLSVCYRCGTPIEPLPSLQWFISVSSKFKVQSSKLRGFRIGQEVSLKDIMYNAVKSGQIEIIPERFRKVYFNWIENLHDWCISRQIWFGHRIPVWYKKFKVQSSKFKVAVQSLKIDITYFVHGTTVDNETGKASGQADVVLSELGIKQSKELKETIKNQKFDIVFCSDLKRAVDSANLTFGDRNIKIIQDKRLKECDYGDLTKKSAKEIEGIEKEVINKPFPNGESYKDVEYRIRDFLNDLINKYPGKKIAIVAHKAPQLALDVILKGKTWEQAMDEDWRKTKAWQAGWKYEIDDKFQIPNSKTEEIYVGVEAPINDYKIAHVFGADINSGNMAGVAEKEFKEDEMPKIAREIGTPESVFILRSKDSKYDAIFRFFSKTGKETPLCGHALLAGAASLDKQNLRIKTLVGDIIVNKENNKTFFQANKPINIEPNFSEKIFPEFFGISENDYKLLGIFSIGTPKLFFEVKDFETLKKIKPDFESLKKWNESKNFSGYCLFTKDQQSDKRFFVRQFNPLLGVNEDEATAVAAGAMAYFVDHSFIVRQGTINFENEITVRQKDSQLFIGGNVFFESEGWIQDPDTLDTWFSSGLWTFSTLLNQDHTKYKTFEEWIANSPDLKKYHPTTVMETGYDILFFWVARMILMTTYALGEIPFEKIYLHGMVRDKLGRKMSKSLGNGIDPVEMIDKYGTDALRLSMVIGSSPGNDIKLYEEKIEGYRNFVNKLWNISRYIIQSSKFKVQSSKLQFKVQNLTLADKWILEHLENLKRHVSGSLERYQFSSAFEGDDGIRNFMWDKLADWYLEISKIEGRKNEAVLVYVLETLLKLCHPFIPFITEQIWQEMGRENLLLIEKWPESRGGITLPQNSDFYTLQTIISGVRKIKSENNIPSKEKVDVIINTDIIKGVGDEDIEIKKDLNKNAIKVIEENKEVIKKLAGVKSIKMASDVEKPKGWVQFYAIVSVYINIGNAVGKDNEIEKRKKEIEKIEKYIMKLREKLGQDDFVANAPLSIVEKEREKYKEAEEKLERLKKELNLLLKKENAGGKIV